MFLFIGADDVNDPDLSDGRIDRHVLRHELRRQAHAKRLRIGTACCLLTTTTLRRLLYRAQAFVFGVAQRDGGFPAAARKLSHV
ncbi:hypothetical protein CTI14_43835, partial [Methylobacterium radiotolerans]